MHAGSLYPHERVIELGVHTLQVLYCQFLAQHLLVEGHAETVVYELPMVESLRASVCVCVCVCACACVCVL